MWLGFIGMSMAGKTSWARRLATKGFQVFHTDDLIAARLMLTTGQCGADLSSLGAWMGMPYEQDYELREQQYLEAECYALEQIADQLERPEGTCAQVVVDMGGSVIYVDHQLLCRLSRLLTVVYLETAPHARERMFNEYLAHPRPLVWHGAYSEAPNESRRAALARSYCQLIATRTRLYEHYCHVRVPYQIYRTATCTTDEFLGYITNALAMH